MECRSAGLHSKKYFENSEGLRRYSLSYKGYFNRNITIHISYCHATIFDFFPILGGTEKALSQLHESYHD